MEEIDIIELLQRVKEGKAPKKIFANGICYQYQDGDIECLYRGHCGEDTLWWLDEVTLFTPILILDKPIIEELNYNLDLAIKGLIKPTEYEKNLGNCIIANANKINEIIRYINKEEK